MVAVAKRRSLQRGVVVAKGWLQRGGCHKRASIFIGFRHYEVFVKEKRLPVRSVIRVGFVTIRWAYSSYFWYRKLLLTEMFRFTS